MMKEVDYLTIFVRFVIQKFKMIDFKSKYLPLLLMRYFVTYIACFVMIILN